MLWSQCKRHRRALYGHVGNLVGRQDLCADGAHRQQRERHGFCRREQRTGKAVRSQQPQKGFHDGVQHGGGLPITNALMYVTRQPQKASPWDLRDAAGRVQLVMAFE